jgi:hypothetical protein
MAIISGVSLIHNKQTINNVLYMEYMYNSLIYRLELAISYRIYDKLSGANFVNNNCISSIATNMNNLTNN